MILHLKIQCSSPKQAIPTVPFDGGPWARLYPPIPSLVPLQQNEDPPLPAGGPEVGGRGAVGLAAIPETGPSSVLSVSRSGWGGGGGGAGGKKAGKAAGLPRERPVRRTGEGPGGALLPARSCPPLALVCRWHWGMQALRGTGTRVRMQTPGGCWYQDGDAGTGKTLVPG